MGKQELDNLVKIERLKAESPTRSEYAGMVASSDNRITVFQTLVHTLGTDNAHIQTFLKAHNQGNLAEYQGRMDIDARLLADLLRSTKALETEVGKLEPSRLYDATAIARPTPSHHTAC